MKNYHFFQLGLGDSAELAPLVKGEKSLLPISLPLGNYTGTLVEANPFAFIRTYNNLYLDESYHSYWNKLSFLLTCISEKEQIVTMGTRTFTDVDFQANILQTSKINFETYSISLDTLLETTDFNIAILALDIQGSEGMVLSSFKFLKRPMYILLEPHGVKNENDCFDILQSNEYRLLNNIYNSEERHPNYLFVDKNINQFETFSTRNILSVI